MHDIPDLVVMYVPSQYMHSSFSCSYPLASFSSDVFYIRSMHKFNASSTLQQLSLLANPCFHSAQGARHPLALASPDARRRPPRTSMLFLFPGHLALAVEPRHVDRNESLPSVRPGRGFFPVRAIIPHPLTRSRISASTAMLRRKTSRRESNFQRVKGSQ
jgi:hypothetical protein